MPTTPVTTQFHVGDHVTFVSAGNSITAEVIEVRGPIGIGGRTLYRLRILNDTEFPEETELPGERLTLRKESHS